MVKVLHEGRVKKMSQTKLNRLFNTYSDWDRFAQLKLDGVEVTFVKNGVRKVYKLVKTP